MKFWVSWFVLLLFVFWVSGFAHEDEDMVLFEADQAMQQEILNSLVKTPEVKEFYVSQCRQELNGLLGDKLESQICECTYHQIILNPSLQYSLINDTEIPDADFKKMVDSCLPQNYTSEMQSAFVATCQKAGSQDAECKCWFKGVKSLYNSPRALVLDVFGNTSRFQSNMTRLLSECLVE